jgi:hypothetical protein
MTSYPRTHSKHATNPKGKPREDITSKSFVQSIQNIVCGTKETHSWDKSNERQWKCRDCGKTRTPYK